MLIEEVIGPVMVGPSSSHTAGAVYLGRFIYSICKGTPKSVKITLYESFAKTGRGHGTDTAIIGGILGFSPDNESLTQSFEIAQRVGLEFSFEFSDEFAPHPNYMFARAVTFEGRQINIGGCSIGGGKIRILQLNDYKVDIGFDSDIVLVTHMDVPGIISEVTGVLAKHGINLGYMSVFRPNKGKAALMLAETDQKLTTKIISELAELENIREVSYLTPFV